MRFLIILFFLMSSSYASDGIDIKNLSLNKELKKYEGLAFLDHENNLLNLGDYKGNLIILNFWATWCAPCKKEMPSLDRLQDHEDLNNLVIFPINVGQESLQKSRKFFEDLKINNLNIYFDNQVTLAKKFGLRGIPTTILFDKNGLEFARIIGSIDFEDEKFIKWLSKFN